MGLIGRQESGCSHHRNHRPAATGLHLILSQVLHQTLFIKGRHPVQDLLIQIFGLVIGMEMRQIGAGHQ